MVLTQTLEQTLKISPQRSSLADYFRLMGIKGCERVFHNALELGVLQSLRASLGPQTANDIAAACGLAEHPTRLMLDVLTELGVARREGDLYFSGDVLQLLQGDYADLSSRYWNYLPEFLRTAKPMFSFNENSSQESTDQFYATQALSLYAMMRTSAELLAKDFLASGMAPLRILDIGAGSCVWSLPFARVLQAVAITALDTPVVLNVAQSLAKNLGLVEKFTYTSAQLFELPSDLGQFDLILVGNVMHMFDEQKNIFLLRSLKRFLAPQGSLVVIDVFSDNPKGQLNVTLYELGLALRLPGARVYKPSCASELLSSAGFVVSDVRFIDAEPHTMGYIVARRA